MSNHEINGRFVTIKHVLLIDTLHGTGTKTDPIRRVFTIVDPEYDKIILEYDPEENTEPRHD